MSLDFETLAGRVREAAELLLVEHFGHRCVEHDSMCITCQRWDALDALLKDPWDDLPEEVSPAQWCAEGIFEQIRRSNVSYAEAIGVLELVKLDLVNEARDTDLSDEDD